MIVNRQLVLSLILAPLVFAGCAHKPPVDLVPHFSPGEGAISGEIIGTDHDAFDLDLAGGAKALKIELLSPSQGVAATTYPLDKKGHFVFNHVPPGRYELTVFVVVTGKRSIAGNLPVSVDSDKIAPVTLMLTVAPTDSGASN